ncbi:MULTISPECIES: molybdenum cofactor guanylyltransferase [unclassified Luteococcus]|uniref:molybdenum cofactor guanylyltransferase n=1 Tax=unclassified Luteococcus TaxID=2639923 RepID=UPI00313EF409
MTRASIILAGGQSRRMGTPKATLQLAGRTLLRHAVDACATFSPIVVVGPPELASLLTDVPGCILTREDPPGGGPSAGLAAGLAALEEHQVETVQVLCCDLPRAVDLVAALDGLDWADHEALVPLDLESWPQYLSARYRLDALRAAVPVEAEARGVGVRRLMRGLHAKLVPLEEELVADVDDPQAARRAGVTLQS